MDHIPRLDNRRPIRIIACVEAPYHSSGISAEKASNKEEAP